MKMVKKLLLIGLVISLAINVIQAGIHHGQLIREYQRGKADGQNMAREHRFESWEAWANYETEPGPVVPGEVKSISDLPLEKYPAWARIPGYGVDWGTVGFE